MLNSTNIYVHTMLLPTGTAAAIWSISACPSACRADHEAQSCQHPFMLQTVLMRSANLATALMKRQTAAIQQADVTMGSMQVGHDSGTMLAYGTGPIPGGTMVVNADASSRSATPGPTGTFVTAGGEAGPQGGSDYQAAVQAASQGPDGSVIYYAVLNIYVCLCNHK